MLNTKVTKILRAYKEIPLNIIIAENVKELMRATPALDTQAKLSKKAGIGQAIISRALSVTKPKSRITDDVWVSTKHLAKLAKAFGVPAWQLCWPRLDPTMFMKGSEASPNEQVLLAQHSAIRAILDRGPFTPRS